MAGGADAGVTVPGFTSHMAGIADPLMMALARLLDMSWHGGSWDDRLDGMRRGHVDAGWVCGLLWAEMRRRNEWDVAPVAAPVMAGARYRSQPVYFGDVIVRGPSGSLADLAESTFVYNEVSSLSGYRMLVDRLGSLAGFGQTVASGSHADSIRMVVEGMADVAVIDSIVMDMARRRRPDEVAAVRVIESLGPYPAPPVVVAPSLDGRAVQAQLAELHASEQGRQLLDAWGIERFAPVGPEDYLALASPAS